MIAIQSLLGHYGYNLCPIFWGLVAPLDLDQGSQTQGPQPHVALEDICSPQQLNWTNKLILFFVSLSLVCFLRFHNK